MQEKGMGTLKLNCGTTDVNALRNGKRKKGNEHVVVALPKQGF